MRHLLSIFLLFQSMEAFALPRAADIGFWLRASDLTNLHDGDKVSEWKDFGNLKNDATQEIYSRQPIFVENSVLGKPSIAFNGYSTFLNLPKGVTLLGNDPLTFFIVLKPTRFSYYAGLFGAGKDGNEIQISLFEDKPALTAMKAGKLSSGISTISLKLGQYVLIEVKKTTTNYFVSVMGKLGVVGSAVDFANDAIGDFRGIGGHPDSKEFFEGEVAEMIFYRGVLDPTESTTISCYLANNYGILINGCR